ncbi:hypothetical protein CKO38_01375, partial [Rhodospirillum rubrum]|uniref:tetratricopeptide repeat protein n=1 Tax=Rhodospirillum rubrum TaxID=1085 RepID=UPI001902E84B
MSPPPAPPPNPIRDGLIARADALREADALAEARDLYRLVLDRHPGHGPALAGLGRILLRLGQPAAALESLGAAAASDPTRLDWLADLAVALAGARRPAEALSAAEGLPATPGALGFRADRLEELGRRDQAIALLDDALRRHPEEAELHRRQGVLLRRAGRAAQAIAHWRALVALRPGDGAAWSSLGAGLGESGLDEEAEKALRRAVALAADEPDWTYNLAHFLIERDRLEDALPLLDAAVARAPGRAYYHTNLGVCRLGLGDIDGAIAAHRQALALDPDEPEARYDLAWALLLAGAWEEGWDAHEARWRMGRFTGRRAAGPAPTDWPMPLWDGQPLGPDRTLLLHAEQGFGDSLMMARLIIPALERADARGIVACPPPLVDLLAHSLGPALGSAVRVVAQAETPPAADAHLPLMSLPHRLGVDSETIPGPDRWLRAELQSGPGDI